MAFRLFLADFLPLLFVTNKLEPQWSAKLTLRDRDRAEHRNVTNRRVQWSPRTTDCELQRKQIEKKFTN